MYWMFGLHAVKEAFLNPKRKVHEILVSKKEYIELFPKARLVSKVDIEQKVSKEALHQGVIARVDMLNDSFESVSKSDSGESIKVVLLDQMTDPHNLGAVARSAAAFGVDHIIMPKDGSPRESGVVAKSACGALEHVSLVYVTNLDRAIQSLQEDGFWIYGLDGSADKNISQIAKSKKMGFVFGSEGSGMRPLIKKRCDELLKIDISNKVESLNLSNAVAITLHHFL